MTEIIMQAYRDVELAMERYNKVLAEHVDALRARASSDATQVERLTQGARAMRDSSMIYLSYAKFIASGMPESEELVQDDLQT